MLAAKFFRRPGSVTTNGLPHRWIIRDAFTKRAGTDNFLLRRCKLFQLQTGFAAQFCTVLSSTTLKCLRINRISVSAKSRTVLIPIASSFLLIRRPIPQTSSTGRADINLRWRSRFDKSTTPPVCRCHFLPHDWQA